MSSRFSTVSTNPIWQLSFRILDFAILTKTVCSQETKTLELEYLKETLRSSYHLLTLLRKRCLAPPRSRYCLQLALDRKLLRRTEINRQPPRCCYERYARIPRPILRIHPKQCTDKLQCSLRSTIRRTGNSSRRPTATP